jgi:hypothetical protein
MTAKKKKNPKKKKKKRAPPAPAPENIVKLRSKKPRLPLIDKRDAAGHFLPGSRPNPAGRPKNSLDLIATLRDVLREEGYDKVDQKDKAKEVCRRLVRNAVLAVKDGEATTAINSILDRIHGKPAQTLHVDERSVDPYEEMSDDELRAIAECDSVIDDDDEEET